MKSNLISICNDAVDQLAEQFLISHFVCQFQ